MLKIFNTSVKKLAAIAAFNKTELVLLRAIQGSKKPLAIHELIKVLGKKRLTLQYNLKKLEKRGIVTCNRSKKEYEWSLNHETPITSTGAEETRVVPVDTAYKLFYESHQHKIWGIQGTGAIKSIYGMIIKNPRMFSGVHTRQKLRKVIVDGIVTEGAIGLLKKLPEEARKSHFGRPTLFHIIPENEFVNQYELLSDGKLFAVIDHKKSVATITHDPVTNSTFVALHEVVKGLAAKGNIAEIWGTESAVG